MTHLALRFHLKSTLLTPSLAELKAHCILSSLPKTHHLRLPPAITQTSLPFLLVIEEKLPMARLATSPEIDSNHISTEEMIF